MDQVSAFPMDRKDQQDRLTYSTNTAHADCPRGLSLYCMSAVREARPTASTGSCKPGANERRQRALDARPLLCVTCCVTCHGELYYRNLRACLFKTAAQAC